MSGDRLWQPRPRQWWGLGIALAVSAAPHLLRLPLWLAAIWVLAVGWRLSLGVQGRPMPALVIRLLLTLAAGVALFLYFGTVLGRDAGSALLVMMVGLKLLELKRRRDATLLILLSYLLLGVQFMFSQGIAVAAYIGAAAIVVTAVRLEQSNTVGARDWRADGLLAARMLAQSLPLLLVLFLLFPRLPGPLWSLPADAHSGRTGLSGEMEPGRISQLALSEAVAFRAEFEAGLPPPAQRYWRGPVFEMSDGRRWWGATPDRQPPATELRLPFRPQGTAYRYTLTLEPSGQPWLPALEMSTSIPADAVRLPTLELKATRPHTTLRRDTYIAFPEVRFPRPDPASLQRNLRLPPAISTRVRQLAEHWRDDARGDGDVVVAALRYFNTQPFVYTLEPPLLGSDPVDQFLFETRRGFCEHYAAAFTTLMRAAGIPARVVTGYQGGEVNPVGGYMIVRQSDAHAWAEVWLDGRGWVRIDPTAAVAPERIERRIDLGLARGGDAVRFRLDDQGLAARSLRRMRFAFDAFNNGWNQWVLSYGPERQRDLFAGFGFRNAGWQELAWALVIGCVVAVAILAAVVLRQRKPPRDRLVVLYERFRSRLHRNGFAPRPQEGPEDLLARIRREQPNWFDQASRVTDLYVRLRYRDETDPAALRDLHDAVRAFRPD